MKWGIRCCLVLSFAFLGGCMPVAKKWEDPLMGMNLRRESNPKKLANFRDGKVPILISKNTKEFVKTKRDFQKYLGNPFVDSGGAKASNDPKIAANEMVAILKRNLPNEYFVIGDISSAKQPELIVILDRWGSFDKNYSAGIDMEDKAGIYLIDVSTQSLLFRSEAASSMTCPSAFKFDPFVIIQKCINDIDNTMYSKLESDLKAALPKPTTLNQGLDNDNDKYREVLETGSDVQLYSLAMSFQQARNNVMASKVYQAIVQRFPQGPYAAKALERQEKLVQ